MNNIEGGVDFWILSWYILITNSMVMGPSGEDATCAVTQEISRILKNPSQIKSAQTIPSCLSKTYLIIVASPDISY
jgi:hypothetical protein